MALRAFVGTLVLLCAYGFFKEVKPSEPYLTEYLVGEEFKNLTKDDVYSKVYPVWSYSYFAMLIPVFLLTDFLRYKPMIMFEGLAYVVTWVLLLWAEGVAAMQVMQFVYGVATSTEIAYYTYIYAKVPKEDYKKVSSFTRCAILMGKFISGLLSQLLDSFDVLDYREFNYISLACVSFAFFLSILLPSVKSSVYFHRSEEEGDDPKEVIEAKEKLSISETMRVIFTDAKNGYSDAYVVKWSVWVAVSTCLYFQVGNYIQTLWEEIRPFDEGYGNNGTDVEIYNGAVEAVATLTGAITVLCVGFVTLSWQKFGDWAILIVSILGGSILVIMSQTDIIWIAYVGYILFRMSYQILMTVASFEIAGRIAHHTTGLIFGINTWFALGFQTILTITVADKAGLDLEVRPQFIVYGSLYLLAGVAFAGYFLFRRLIQR